MSEKLVYLAGPLAGQEFVHAVAWRDYVNSQLAMRSGTEIHCISPMRGKPSIRVGDIINSTKQDNTALNVVPKQIVARDRYDVQRCDVVLAYFWHANKVSIGTCFELAWANAWNKPIIIVKDTMGYHDHIFIDQVAHWVLDDLDDAITVIVDMFTTVEFHASAKAPRIQ